MEFLCASTQENTLHGIVRNADNNQPLSGVNIFLDQTTVGTYTDDNGHYELTNLPSGPYDLVFSFVGFKRYTRSIKFPLDEPQELNILLKPKKFTLNESKVIAKDPEEWRRNLERFKDRFIGISRNADEVSIINPEILNFEFEKGLFTATASEPLIIRNEALGYRIKLFIDKFTFFAYNDSEDGYTRFEKLTPANDKQLKHWQEERMRAYKGSFRQFIHAMRRDELQDKGFNIVFTNSKRRIYSSNRGRVNNRIIEAPIEHPGHLWHYTTLDQIALSTYKGYKYLKVTYENEAPEQNIARRTGTINDRFQVSLLEFPRGKAVINVNHNLAFKDPYRIIFNGYWAWSQRIPDWLPQNYSPY